MKKLILLIGLLGLNVAAFGLEVGETAPCVVLNHIQEDGREAEKCIREPRVEGQLKVLEFFSATCSDCRRNLPLFSQLHTNFNSDVTFRLVGIDRSEALLRNYVKEFSNIINFDVALDTDRDAKRAYDVFATPTLFVLDQNDEVIYKHTGVLGASDIAELEVLFRQ